MSNYVQPAEYINYISEFKRIFVNRNNGQTNQLFKIDSNISDEYYFQIVSKNNQIVSLSGRSFQIYGSYQDAKNVNHILFYTPSSTIETLYDEYGNIKAENVLHFHINTYNQEYLSQITTNKQANITIVEQDGDNTQVVLRDVCLCYKRPYIENYVPAEVYTVNILTGTMPWVNEFGAGQNINLIEGAPNFAFGSNLSTASNQFVVGDTNTPDGTKAFIVANSGNVFTVDYNGNVQAGAISATSLTVNGSQVATNADLTGFATEDWVQEQGYLTEHQDLSDYATKDWVEGKGYITGVNLDAYATEQWVKDQGYLTGVDLTDYATKNDLSLSTANLGYQISQLALEVPTKTSDLTNDSGYITGYTAGTGISISNQNVISINGELGKTYYADETTLQLNEANNTFSVKSIRTKLNNGPGISLTEDGNGVVTITNTGGSGGGGGYVYTNGTGLGLSTITENEEYQFYVDEAWFNQHIDAYTSGIQNLSAGTGLKIEDNVISLTAQIPSIDGLASEQYVQDQIAPVQTEVNGLSSLVSAIMEIDVPTSSQIQTQIENNLTDYATQEWVGEQGYLTAHQSLSAYSTSEEIAEEYAKKTDIPETSAFVTSTFVENAISGKADKTDLTGLVSTAQIADMATTGWVTGYTSAFITAEDLPTEKTKVSQLQNDVGYITIASVPDVTGFATKSELQTVSSTIEGEIPDVSNLATKTELETVSTAIVEQIPTVPTNVSDFTNDAGYITDSALNGYATESYVTGQIDSATSALATESELTSVSTQLTNALGNKANSDDVYSKTVADETFATKNEIPSLDNYYNKTEVDNKDSAASGAAVDAATGWVDGQHYLTAHQSLDNYYNKTQVDTALALKANAADVYDKTSTYTKTEVNAISTALSSTVSGAGYLTEHQSLADYYTKSEVNTITGTLEGEITGKADTSAVNDQFAATSAWANATFLTEHQDLSDYAETSYVNTVSGNLHDEITETTSAMATTGYVQTEIAKIPAAAEYGAGTGLERVFENDKYVFNLTGTILTGGTNIEVVGKAINFTGTIPTSASQLTNDEGFITGITVNDTDNGTTENVTAFEFSGDDFQTSISDDTVNIYWIGLKATDSQSNEYYVKQIHYSDDFTINEGDGYVDISLTTPVPTNTSDLNNDSDFATSAYVTGQVNDLATGAVATNTTNIGLISSDLANKVTSSEVKTQIEAYGYITGITNNALISDVTSAINEISGTISTDYALKSELTDFITGITINYNDSNYSVTEFDVGEGLKFDTGELSIDVVIPTAISDLENDSEFATSANVSAIVTGYNYATTGLLSSTSAAIIAEIPTNVSDLTNDEGFIKGININVGESNIEDATEITFDSDFVLDSEYIKIDAQNFITNNSLVTSTDIEGLATTDYVTGAINDLVTGQIDSLTGRVNTLENAGYQTSGDVSGLLTSNNYVTSGQISADYAKVADLPVVSTYVAGANVTITPVENENKFTVSATDTTYTAGTGLKLTGTEFSLSAAGAGENKVLSSANGNIVWADNVAGGSTVDVDTICGMLSSANENLTIAKSNEKILFTVTGGGSTGNIVGGAGIRVMQQGQNTIISIATAALIATPTSYTFDFRNTSGTVDFDYDSYTGNQNLIMSYEGILPNGVSATQIASGYQFDYVSAANVGNNNSTITAYFDAYDITQPASAEVQITTVGYVSATIQATSAEITFNAQSGTTTGSVAFTYQDGGATVSVTFGNELPEGVTAEVSGNSVVFTGVGSLFTSNTTYSNTMTLTAIDANPITVNLDIVIEGIVDPELAMPLTFTFTGNDSGAIKLKKNSISNPQAQIQYKIGDGEWTDISYDNWVGGHNFTKGETIAFRNLNNNFTPESWSSNYYSFEMSGTWEASGNIESLRNYDNGDSNYFDLFTDCSGLVRAPKLPASGNVRYAEMFKNCTSLTAAPELPASGGNVNYRDMFNGCTSLITPPSILPSITLTNSQNYYGMFQGCSGLVSAPQILADTLTERCCNWMFAGCKSLTGAVIAATNINANYSCQQMFTGCTSFRYLNVNFTSWPGGNQTQNWLSGVPNTSECTFVKPSQLSAYYNNDYGIPTNWTVQNK